MRTRVIVIKTELVASSNYVKNRKCKKSFITETSLFKKGFFGSSKISSQRELRL